MTCCVSTPSSLVRSVSVYEEAEIILFTLAKYMYLGALKAVEYDVSHTSYTSGSTKKSLKAMFVIKPLFSTL